MKFDKLIFKKPSTYVFGIFCTLCVVMFVFALVKILSFSGGGNASRVNLFQIGFSACTFLVLCLLLSIRIFSKFEISEFLSVYALTYVFVFFGVFSCFGLYYSKIALFVFLGFTGITSAIFCISIFFHLSKSQDGTVRAKPFFMALFMIGLSVFVIALVETLVFLITKSMPTKLLFETKDFVLGLLFGFVGSVLVALISVISLTRDKKFVNMCLILKRK